MASELSITGRFYYSKGGAIIDRQTGTTQFDISGTEIKTGVVSIATSDTTVTIPSAPGYCYVKNLDATNFIQVGPDATNWFLKLKAGQWSIFPINGTALHAKADTSACNLEFISISL